MDNISPGKGLPENSLIDFCKGKSLFMGKAGCDRPIFFFYNVFILIFITGGYHPDGMPPSAQHLGKPVRRHRRSVRQLIKNIYH